MKEIIPVMHCFDNNFVIPAAVSFYSMLANASRDYEYRLYVLHNDITIENQRRLTALVEGFEGCSLEFIDTKGKFTDLFAGWKQGASFTKEVLYKIIAPTTFPQYDKMIITDVDVVFLGDISEEYLKFDVTESGDDEGCYIAGEGRFHSTYLTDYTEMDDDKKREIFQILGGYWIINNRKFRNEKKVDELISYAYEHIQELGNLEQTLVNICLYPNFKILPPTTLVAAGEYIEANRRGKSVDELELIDKMCRNPMQLHYSMKHLKPWDNLLCPEWDKWFEYLRKTDYYQDWMRNLQRAVNVTDSLKSLWKIKIPGRNRFFSGFVSGLKARKVTRMLNTTDKSIMKL